MRFCIVLIFHHSEVKEATCLATLHNLYLQLLQLSFGGVHWSMTKLLQLALLEI